MDSTENLFAEIDQMELNGTSLVIGDCAWFKSSLYSDGRPVSARIINIVREKNPRSFASKNIYFVVNLYIQDPGIISTRHFFITERLLVLHSSSFLEKIWIIPYWQYQNGVRPSEAELKNSSKSVFWFALFVPIVHVDACIRGMFSEITVNRIEPKMLDNLVPDEYKLACMQISNSKDDETEELLRVIPRIKSFSSSPASYTFPCSKCRFTSDCISNVAYHYLGHFSLNGNQIIEVPLPNFPKIPFKPQKLMQSAQYLERINLASDEIDNSDEVETKFSDKVKMDSSGKIIWFKSPPLFIPFRRQTFPSVEFLLYCKDKKVKRSIQRVSKITVKNEVEIPSREKLCGIFLFNF